MLGMWLIVVIFELECCNLTYTTYTKVFSYISLYNFSIEYLTTSTDLFILIWISSSNMNL